MTQADGCGVRIAGVGSSVPAGVLSNADLEKMLDTTDEWIVQRTGIRERRIVDRGLNDGIDGDFRRQSPQDSPLVPVSTSSLLRRAYNMDNIR